MKQSEPPAAPTPQRYGRYVGLLGLVLLGLITLNTLLTKPNGSTGVPPGSRVPPFAVPLALAGLEGDADVARQPNEGSAGKHAACSLRGAEILNICQLYEQGPVVLALFVNGGSCTGILSDMQELVPSFPGVRFAAVAIKGNRTQLRQLVRTRGLTFPVGIDSDGALAVLYKIASCPQVSFINPGGIVQSRALLGSPTISVLRARVSELLASRRTRVEHRPA